MCHDPAMLSRGMRKQFACSMETQVYTRTYIFTMPWL